MEAYMKLSIENKIFLEEAIRGMDYSALLFQLANNPNLSEEDRAYMIHAYLLPKNEFDEYIALYENSKPKMDELKFIQYLVEKYQVPRNIIFLRIRQVKRMNKAIKKYQKNNLGR